MSRPTLRQPGAVARRAPRAAALAVAFVLAATPAAVAGPEPLDDVEVPDLDGQTIAAGPPATYAWTVGTRVRVAAPGVPDRTVAWLLPRASDDDLVGDPRDAVPALSRDGRRLVVIGDDDAWLVPITTGGEPVRLPTGGISGDAEARWSADGRTVLIVGSTLTRCAVEPALRCVVVGRRLVTEYGATVSPDGTSVAYVRASRAPGGLSTGTIVLRGPDGRGRVLERPRVVGRRFSVPTPPTWTATGLVWGVIDARDLPGDDVRYLRARTRSLGADGAVRTITAGSIAGGRTVPFLPFGDAPGGAGPGAAAPGGTAPDGAPGPLAFGARYRIAGGDAVRLDLRILATDGTTRALGLSLGDLRRRNLAVLGILADGRIAVVEDRPVDGGDGVGSDRRLYLVAPGARSLGRPVARGREVDVAAAFPNDARSF